MEIINTFISKTLKPALIIFGLLTCLPILAAADIKLLQVFANGIDYTESSIPALRHWGFMVLGIGGLLFVSAFMPWVRFTAMVYSTLEKSFMVYLWLTNLDKPWGGAYTGMGILDSIICIYSIIYFISSYGRPEHWEKKN